MGEGRRCACVRVGTSECLCKFTLFRNALEVGFCRDVCAGGCLCISGYPSKFILFGEINACHII